MRNVAKKGLLTAVATGSVLASTAGYAYASAGAEGDAVGSPGVASGNSVQVPVHVPVNACGNTVDVIGVLNPAYGNNCANASGRSGAGGHAGSGAAASGSGASGTAVGSPGVVSGNSIQAPVHIPVNACGNSVDVVGAANPAFGNDCANAPAPVHTPPATPDEDCPEEHGPHNPPPPATSHPTTPPTHTPGSGETTPGVPRAGGPTATTPSGGTPSAAATGGAGQARPSGQAVPASARTGSPSAAPSAVGSELASTGAGSTELLGAAGLALLIGGGVLYRRARAGAR
ncbi:chaplin [Kitasatospora sp. NBC_00458]|uniref:chaplin n=1 Tax=Kitasatospora sp. NBC_00458 TaxID=2903568 RepID=UPI002E194B08